MHGAGFLVKFTIYDDQLKSVNPLLKIGRDTSQYHLHNVLSILLSCENHLSKSSLENEFDLNTFSQSLSTGCNYAAMVQQFLTYSRSLLNRVVKPSDFRISLSHREEVQTCMICLFFYRIL